MKTSQRITLIVVSTFLSWQSHASEYFSIELYDMSNVTTIDDQFLQWPLLIDLDNDDDLDLLVTSWDFYTDEKDPAFVMINDGDGHFTFDISGSITPAPTVGSQHWPLFADFNQDGIKDLYVFGMGNEGSEELDTQWAGTYHQLFLIAGDNGLVDVSGNSFAEVRRSIAHTATAGDIDGDGDIDIFNGGLGFVWDNLSTQGTGGIVSFFWINNGDATFTANNDKLPDYFSRGCPIEGCEEEPRVTNIQDALFVDTDRDGDLDLLLTFHRSVDSPLEFFPDGEVDEPVFHIMLNDGSGNFTRAPAGLVPTRVPSGPDFFSYNLFSTDVNGDGWPDVFLSVVKHGGGDGELQLMLNNGDGSFTDASTNIVLDGDWIPQDWMTDGYILQLLFADFNQDSWIDILTLGSGIKPKLLYNNGDGTFADVTSILDSLPNDDAIQLQVGDIDGDLDIDIVSPSTGCGIYCPSFEIARNTKPYRAVDPPSLPATPGLISPADKAVVATPPALQWDHVQGAQTYAVQISQDIAFSSFEKSDLDINSLTGNKLELSKLTQLVRFEGLERDKIYYWRVAGENFRGRGEWSETRRMAYSLDSGWPATDVSVVKSDSKDPVNQSESFSYTLLTKNNGPLVATNLVVTDTLPTGVVFISASGTDWTCGEVDGTVTCNFDKSMAVDESSSITVNVSAPATLGLLTNLVTISAAEDDPVSPNDNDSETTEVTDLVFTHGFEDP